MTSPSDRPVSRTILVVDDEPMVRSVIARLLKQWDFTVIEADNGKSALQVARKHRDSLSMVVTDLAMPYMDGYEFAKAFRSICPNVPILFMTGKCPDALVYRISNAGEHILFKPFDPDGLLDIVARLLEAGVNQNQGRMPA